MKAKILFIILSVLAGIPAKAAWIGGQVKDIHRQPMAEVIVSDGRQFVYTDTEGRYKMDVDEDAEFIFLITPDGYVADYSDGVPRFWLPIQKEQQAYDFVLQPMKGEQGRSVMLGMADTQLDRPRDVKRFFSETLPDVQQLLTGYENHQKAMFIAGDLTWDNYAYQEKIKQFAREAGIPLYPVIGNHDYDKYASPQSGADLARPYKQQFGPTYYAFWMGGACYIVLNSIKYQGYKRYTHSLDQGHQWEWLSLLLQVVLQQDHQLFLLMHAPLSYQGDRIATERGEELIKMLANKPFRASIFSGHLHTNSVYHVGQNIWEHNIGSVGGFFWTSDYSGDGTPNGYKVIEGKGEGVFHQHYHSTGHPSTYQMQTYRPGVIAERPYAVCCKIWNADSRWSVRWYQDGVFRGAMQPFYSFSPEYLQYLDGQPAAGDYVPKRTRHFYSAQPDPGAHTIRIEAEDPYGVVYTEETSLE